MSRTPVWVVVPPGGTTGADLPLELSRQGRSTILDHVDYALDVCAYSAELAPSLDCPIGSTQVTPAGPVRWQTERSLRLSFTPEVNPAGHVTVTVETTTRGIILLSGDHAAGGGRRPFTIELEFAVSGTVVLRPGEVDLGDLLWPSRSVLRGR